MNFNIFHIPLNNSSLEIKAVQNTLGNIEEIALEKSAIFAVNANFGDYAFSNGVWGPLKADGVAHTNTLGVWFPLNSIGFDKTTTGTQVYFFDVAARTSQRRRLVVDFTGESKVAAHQNVITGTPNMMQSEEYLREYSVLTDVSKGYNNTDRTMIGYTDHGAFSEHVRHLVVITCGGAPPEHPPELIPVGCAIADLIALRDNYQLTDAVNFDGSGSTQAWGAGRTIVPSKDDRKIWSALVVVARPPS